MKERKRRLGGNASCPLAGVASKRSETKRQASLAQTCPIQRLIPFLSRLHKLHSLKLQVSLLIEQFLSLYKVFPLLRQSETMQSTELNCIPCLPLNIITSFVPVQTD